MARSPITGAANFPMRQITRPDEATGRQVHILATRTDLTRPSWCIGWAHAAPREPLQVRPNALRHGFSRLLRRR